MSVKNFHLKHILFIYLYFSCDVLFMFTNIQDINIRTGMHCKQKTYKVGCIFLEGKKLRLYCDYIFTF